MAVSRKPVHAHSPAILKSKMVPTKQYIPFFFKEKKELMQLIIRNSFLESKFSCFKTKYLRREREKLMD